jgi:sRNA-binding regulator protein Hfq
MVAMVFLENGFQLSDVITWLDDFFLIRRRYGLEVLAPVRPLND